jgi:hypothetical protein
MSGSSRDVVKEFSIYLKPENYQMPPLAKSKKH